MVSATGTCLIALEKWTGDHNIVIQELNTDTSKLKEGVEGLDDDDAKIEKKLNNMMSSGEVQKSLPQIGTVKSD
jgi:hypothetical protein